MKKYRVIAIDGPAGSGKSTTAKLLAEKLGFTYLDTGAMYRCVTLAAMNRNLNLQDEDQIGHLAQSLDIDLIPDKDNGNLVILNGADVTSAIRTPSVDADVSIVSSYKAVREKMVAVQRKFSERGDVVAEGRDIATVVFPKADLKIFLTADLETRARRRCLQNEAKGIPSTIEEQMSALAARDLLDSGRAISPLRKDAEAIELDTSGLSIEEQVEKAYFLAHKRLN
jgi:CMP/dCMP kinase